MFSTVNFQALTVFAVIFIAVTALGFIAARWRSGDLSRIQEWGLAGRRFGTVVSWFLLGGDIYTAYSFVAVPALIYSQGALGFFAVAYLVLSFPFMAIFLPRFWTIARHRGYLTTADFVRERFDSSGLALLVAIVSILATMPYLALQMYGIELTLAQMGIPVEAALFIAFAILASYTYISGLRAPALIAFVKDACIWLVVLIAIFYIPPRLGGFGEVFAAVEQKGREHVGAFSATLMPEQYSTYATLALGSALALFLYPHVFTGMLSTNSRKVIQRNAVLLPAYTFLIGLIGLLGYLAIAANVQLTPPYGANSAVLGLFDAMFPPWFAGFAFATIAIGALAPAAVMSIAAANLFTRNIYREYLRPNCTEQQESNMAKTASLVAKIGALTFILLLPGQLAINFQLLSNIWIVQTLPAVFLGLYTNWFHRWALSIGLVGGFVMGTWMVIAQGFKSSIYPLTIGGETIPVYAALISLLFNLFLTVLLTLIFNTLKVNAGEDATSPMDFKTHPVQMLAPTTQPDTRP